MKNLNWTALPLAFSLIFSLQACVTVNVNIPEGDIQQASDSYVKELYAAKQKGADKSSDDLKNAGNPKVKTDSPKARELYAHMKDRSDQITEAKKTGALGETNDGKLIVKVKPEVAEQLAKLKKLVDDENKDRTALYAELIKQNPALKSNHLSFQQHFAEAFQEHSPNGTWIEDDEGNWAQKQ